MDEHYHQRVMSKTNTLYVLMVIFMRKKLVKLLACMVFITILFGILSQLFNYVLSSNLVLNNNRRRVLKQISLSEYKNNVLTVLQQTKVNKKLKACGMFS